MTFNYDKSEYSRNHDPITITCPVHAEFQQPPSDHLGGHGCPLCADQTKGAYRKKDTTQFISEARLVHGDKYDYRTTQYAGSTEKLLIRSRLTVSLHKLPPRTYTGRGVRTAQSTGSTMLSLLAFITCE
jgi:hypothetical protein